MSSQSFARILTRDVTTEECHWLDEDMQAGTVVYEYDGPTFGVISPNGVACTMVFNFTPFFELPSDSIEALPDGM